MKPTGKKNIEVTIRYFAPDDFLYLKEMYDTFAPKGAFQGMPPRSEEVAEKWLRRLVHGGENYLAWHGARVLGHVVLLPDYQKMDAEYLIFVHQCARSSGIGKKLTLAVIQRAGEMGLKQIWLTVDAFNFIAIKLYRKAGFRLLDDTYSSSERILVMEL